MKSDKISRLVTENINLIYLVMKRFRNRGVDREDLFQIGAVGLTKAAQRFDESKGFAFSTYAVPLIIGEIQRFLRDDGMVHISRKIRDDARKIAIIREKYRMNENSEISLEKMEIISGMSKQDIIIAMEADKNASSIENESVLDYLDNKMSAEASDKPSETDKVINHIAMQQAFNSLDDSERRLIMLRYMQDKSVVIPVEKKKDGSFSARSGVLSREEMQLISSYVDAKIRSIGREILDGKIAANPYEKGNEEACTYCAYKKVCGFDGSIPGYEKRQLEDLDKQTLMQRMQETTEA